jgi:glycine cleavage system protein P-like pyridoxal-binding family
MAAPNVAPQLQSSFGSKLIVVDPANPDRAELEIVQHLKHLEAEKRAKSALIALGTVALGLLVLAAFVPQD